MSLKKIEQEVVGCQKCPRLVQWCSKVAHEKRKSFETETYWGKPVPSFGDSKAQVLIVGLAPAAHGANRTGRMFTGDNSGKWLYRALFEHGFSNLESSSHRQDGLALSNAYITAVVHCAPPDNKPNPAETQNCILYLERELNVMKNVKVILALGSFAWDAIYKLVGTKNQKKPKFGHGVVTQMGHYHIVGSYHPSQQNTFTKRLTKPMFDDVFKKIKRILA